METLLGKTLAELQEVALAVGLQKFAGKQLAEWLYVRRVKSFDEMTNISLKGREALKANYTIGRHGPVREAVVMRPSARLSVKMARASTSLK